MPDVDQEDGGTRSRLSLRATGLQTVPQNDMKAHGAPRAAALGTRATSRVDWGRFSMRLSRLSSWPVALKLSLAFLVAALVPMELTAAYNLHQSLESVRRSAHLNLELFAG